MTALTEIDFAFAVVFVVGMVCGAVLRGIYREGKR